MAKGTGVPSLEEFLVRPTVPCVYVRSTTPEQRGAIEDVIDQGHNKWAGFARWLKAQGVDVSKDAISSHYSRAHDADA